MSERRRLLIASVLTVLGVATLLGMAVALTVEAAARFGYLRGGGIADNLPLAALAFVNALTWMPALMPLMIPVALLLIVLVAAFAYPIRYVRHNFERWDVKLRALRHDNVRRRGAAEPIADAKSARTAKRPPPPRHLRVVRSRHA